jgi:hypothetical protein
MLLRNGKYECTVTRKGRDVLQNVSMPVPVVPLPDPLLSQGMEQAKNNPPRYKLLVFRMPEALKTDFKMALLKNHLDIQHTFEAFAEVFIMWTNGEKMPDAMKAVLKRSITLMNGV